MGATANPDSAWVTQQARNLAIEERLTAIRFLLRDRDAKFSGPFDELFRTEEVQVISTPVRAPKANAFAERFVRTVRSECLDHVLIFGRRHLDRVFRAYVSHYTEQRPHRGLDLATPVCGVSSRARYMERRRIDRRDVLGGLIHEYGWAA
jgi:putative transposase